MLYADCTRGHVPEAPQHDEAFFRPHASVLQSSPHACKVIRCGSRTRRLRVMRQLSNRLKKIRHHVTTCMTICVSCQVWLDCVCVCMYVCACSHRLKKMPCTQLKLSLNLGLGLFHCLVSAERTLLCLQQVPKGTETR